MPAGIGYGNTDGISTLLAGNNAFGTGRGMSGDAVGSAVNPYASGLAAIGLGMNASSRAKSALNSSGQVNLETMGDTGRLQLDELLKLLGGNAAGITQDFSKGAAIRDSAGLVQNIFDNYQKTALPTIFNAQTGAGAYNSTGAQLLANDAFAQTTNKAAGAVNQNILNYSAAYQQQMQPLLAALGVDKGSRTVGTDTRGQAAAAMQAATAGAGAKSSGGAMLGQAVGSYFGGPVGAAFGGSIGSMLF